MEDENRFSNFYGINQIWIDHFFVKKEEKVFAGGLTWTSIWSWGPDKREKDGALFNSGNGQVQLRKRLTILRFHNN